jgi:hypothetical protein
MVAQLREKVPLTFVANAEVFSWMYLRTSRTIIRCAEVANVVYLRLLPQMTDSAGGNHTFHGSGVCERIASAAKLHRQAAALLDELLPETAV